MSFQNVLVIIIVLVFTVILISEKLRPDLLALLALIVLGLTGLVRPQDLFSGFSRSAVITIMALFIITAGLERTGASRILGQQLSRLAGSGESRSVTAVMLATAMLSLIMNNIAAAAVLLPAVIGVTRQSGLKPSKLLIPVSFGSLLGGMATLFTTANILVSAALVDQGLRPYGVLDFVPVGLPMAAAGIVFMALIGWRLLPDHGIGGEKNGGRDRGSLAEEYGLSKVLTGAYVKLGSAMAGQSLAKGGWDEKLGLSVVAISRGGAIKLAPSPADEVIEGDVVLFTGIIDDEDLAHYGLIRTEDPAWQGRFVSAQVSLVEIVLTPRSPFAGKALREVNFREKFDLTVLALWRGGKTIRAGLMDIPLQFGDAFLVQGSHSRINLLRSEPGFLILEVDVGEIQLSRKTWFAVTAALAAVVLPAANVLPVAEATFSAAFMMVLLGCLNMDEAYSAVEWRAIFLIAGMLPLGLAMTGTGTAGLLGDLFVHSLGNWGSLALAGGLFIVTTLFTQVISGQVAAVVLAPIAIAAARVLGADPRAIGMAVAMGCSTAFLTPFSHPSNVLVMGPGGYTTRDYLRVGLPLTLLLFVVFMLALAVFWNVR